MARRNTKYHGSNLSFIDMLFNIIIVFALIFFAAVLLINEPTKKKDIEAKADVIITMTWPDKSPHDIDLWLKTPEGVPISYGHRENTYVFLERDDLGIKNNYVWKDGEKVVLTPRREVMSFRGKMNGRYVVNTVFFYAYSTDGEKGKYDGTPVPVVIELVQINPEYRVLKRKEIILTHVKEERTAFSFIVNGDEITDIDDEIEEPFSQGPVGE